ncbi:MAG: hypothetical protein KAR08_11270 [Candidatus Heimdallarchaeota archaeon]|nr:hypothetical protein [Candidatus Heimdallarchaeota archaeon]
MVNEGWSGFKDIVNAYTLSASIKYVDHGDYYSVFVETTTELFKCLVRKTSPKSTNQTEFETMVGI